MDDTDSMTNLNNQIGKAIQHRLIEQGRSQTDLGRELFPDNPRPGNIVSQYARAQRGGLSKNLLKILEALGAESIEIKWKDEA